MIKRHFHSYSYIFIAGFAMVLFLRSFGVLALFQHAPLVDGYGVDKHYAKRAIFFKKDIPSEGATFTQHETRNYLEAECILPQQVFLPSDAFFLTPLLRAPPLSF